MEYNLKEKKNEYSLIFTIVRFSTECRKLNLGGGGGTSYNGLYGEALARKGFLFQAGGI